MDTATPETLVLSWKPERDDFKQAFRALRRSRGARGRAAVLAGTGIGFLTADQTLISFGVIGVLAFLVVVALGPALTARAIWRRSTDLGHETQVRAVPGEGLE